jgi:Domain of Unknown Function with PDB structure (DUF3857)/Transglutaminase-like superfamily
MRDRARWLWVALIVASAIRPGVPAANAQTQHAGPRPVVPLIRSDTIYPLAVDSTEYPDHGSILLLDDVVVTIQADGRKAVTRHQIIQVLRHNGAEALQERRIEYDPDHQHATLDWTRVLKTDGTMISEKPSLVQESDVATSVTTQAHARRKLIRMSLSGVAPGTLVDACWTIDEWKPYRPGDFYFRWRLATQTSVRRGRLVIDAPKDMVLHMLEHHLDFERRDTVIGLRQVHQWVKQQVRWHRQEWYAPPIDSTDAAVGVDVAASATWHDIGVWFANLAADQLHPDKAIQDTVRSVVARATTLSDSVHAVYRWVAQDIRYVAANLESHEYRPRFPDSVVAAGLGDSKDKATLLIDALGVIGVQAFPVLTSVIDQPDSTLPTMRAFDHELVAIRKPSGYQYADPTSAFYPLERLAEPDAGKFALVIGPDGRVDDVTTPTDSADSSRMAVTLTGELTGDGTFSGRVVVSGRGASEAWLRAIVSPSLDSAQRTTWLRSLAANTIPDVKIDSLVLFDSKDFKAAPVVSFVIRDAHPTQRQADVDILPHFDASATFTQMANGAAGPYRSQPIDAARILPSSTFVDEIHIALPPGWKARLPPSVSASSVFGSFDITYQQNGRSLDIVRRATGGRGLFPKNRVGDVFAWLRECAKDHAPEIIIDHAAASSPS